MKKHLFYLCTCAILLLSFVTSAQENTRNPPEGNLALPVLYEIPEMESVSVVKNIPFKTLDDETLYMDIYTPAGDEQESYPVVMLSSGDLTPYPEADPKDWGQYTSWGTLIAASDMAAVVFSHRSSRENIQDAMQDVDDGIAYVIEHAETYHLDTSRMCFMGFSAQVPLAITPALRGTSDTVKCAVAYYGVMSLGGRRNASYSPQDYVRNAESLPPIFIAKAGLDSPNINRTIDQFVEVANRRGFEVELVEHPNGVHGFDLLTDDDTTREIIQQTLEFLKRHLEG